MNNSSFDSNIHRFSPSDLDLNPMNKASMISSIINYSCGSPDTIPSQDDHTFVPQTISNNNNNSEWKEEPAIKEKNNSTSFHDTFSINGVFKINISDSVLLENKVQSIAKNSIVEANYMRHKEDIIWLNSKRLGGYGNSERAKEILDTEVYPLDPLDRFLFENVFLMSLPKPSHTKELKSTYKWNKFQWGELKNRYRFLAEDQSYFFDIHSGWQKLKSLRAYLLDHREVSRLGLRHQNAEDLLKITKMFDWAIAFFNCVHFNKIPYRGSYSLRLKILEITPKLSTSEVFTKTLSDHRLNDNNYLMNSKNWVDQRVAYQAKALMGSYILACSLSSNDTPNGLIGCRGNTAAGKTTALGYRKGCMDTDPIKCELKKGTGIKNYQVHHEGAMIFDLCFDEVNKTVSRYIVDLRLIQLADIMHYLVEPARIRTCTVSLNDFDVPLQTTFNRVLNRNPTGRAPIPAIEPMIAGFKGIRKHRVEVLRAVKDEEIIVCYALYNLGKLVGKKEWGQFEIFDDLGFAECFQEPNDDEIEKCLKKVIDEEYILEAIERGDFLSDEPIFLDKWEGMTVQQALKKQQELS